MPAFLNRVKIRWAGGIGSFGLVFHFQPPYSLSLQFTVVGVFGETPEPAVAVDAISIAPCGGESKALVGPDCWSGGGTGEQQRPWPKLLTSLVLIS